MGPQVLRNRSAGTEHHSAVLMTGGNGPQPKDHTQTHTLLRDTPHLQPPHLHSAPLVPWITAHVVQHCSAWERSQLSISKLSAALTHRTPDESCNRNQTALSLCSESLLLSCPALNVTLWRLIEGSGGKRDNKQAVWKWMWNEAQQQIVGNRQLIGCYKEEQDKLMLIAGQQIWFWYIISHFIMNIKNSYILQCLCA